MNKRFFAQCSDSTFPTYSSRLRKLCALTYMAMVAFNPVNCVQLGEEAHGPDCAMLDTEVVKKGEKATFLFEVEEADSFPFVGVTSKSYFAEGYRLKMLGYGGPGNLSNGGGALRISWSRIGRQQRHEVRVHVAVSEDDRIQVWYELNGTYLGQAYDVKMPKMAEEGVRPVVQGSRCSVRITKINGDNFVPPGNAPTQTNTVYRTDDATSAFFYGGPGRHFDGNITSNSVSIRVINNLVARLGPDGTLRPAISTMMAGPPHMMRAEATVSNFLKGAKVTEQTADRFVLTNGQQNAVFIRTEVPVTNSVVTDPQFS